MSSDMSFNHHKKVEAEIEKIILDSDIPEDYAHALDVREWVLKFKPDADWALRFAAFAHDVERALPERKVRRSDFLDYDSFKKAHAKNSARIVDEIFSTYPIDQSEKEKILRLIEYHEIGPDQDPELVFLRDADSLSFFKLNLSLYAQRHSEEEVLFRMKWGFQRLSEKGKKMLKDFHYEDEKLSKYLKLVINS
ncbi:MAG: DUF4202 family protein [Candidatus Aminicenantales bacterium]